MLGEIGRFVGRPVTLRFFLHLGAPFLGADFRRTGGERRDDETGERDDGEKGLEAFNGSVPCC